MPRDEFMYAILIFRLANVSILFLQVAKDRLLVMLTDIYSLAKALVRPLDQQQ